MLKIWLKIFKYGKWMDNIEIIQYRIYFYIYIIQQVRDAKSVTDVQFFIYRAGKLTKKCSCSPIIVLHYGHSVGRAWNSQWTNHGESVIHVYFGSIVLVKNFIFPISVHSHFFNSYIILPVLIGFII